MIVMQMSGLHVLNGNQYFGLLQQKNRFSDEKRLMQHVGFCHSHINRIFVITSFLSLAGQANAYTASSAGFRKPVTAAGPLWICTKQLSVRNIDLLY